MRTALIALATASFLTGCENYTAAPVCNDGNAVNPPGMTGVYTISTQNEDFTTTTQEFSIGVDERGRLQDDDEGRVCQVAGQFIQESFDADRKGYSQSRLYVTQMGLTTVPLFYDKAVLDAAGVPTKIFEVPEGARRVLGKDVTEAFERFAARAAEPVLGLMIDNAQVAPELVMGAARASPVGVTLIRK